MIATRIIWVKKWVRSRWWRGIIINRDWNYNERKVWLGNKIEKGIFPNVNIDKMDQYYEKHNNIGGDYDAHVEKA